MGDADGDEVVNVNDDDEKSVSWFRKALKTGGIAGGIAGFVVGCLAVSVMVYLFRGIDSMVSAAGGFKDEPVGMVPGDWLCLAAMFGGYVLGGAAGGCLAGIVAGRLMRGKGGFVPVIAIVSAVAGVFGAYYLAILCMTVMDYLLGAS